ncbi:MAG TPA: NmrA family NAD(P)-binding protein [Thermoanaerobaculia bacterium]|nr:NmrA family NAD(P)-binding protein [Thermoanaerobaculia bacterium]
MTKAANVTMKVLVLGGTGTVGSQVVRELLSRGADVSVLTRDLEKPLPPGVRAIEGDLLDPATARSAFAGMDGIFLLNAVSATECHEGLMAVNGARLGGVKKIVYLSVHEVDKAPHLPHFGAKLAVEAAIRAAGIPFTILRPNNFFQNDVWTKDALLGFGVYPQPIGQVGLSRVDVRDIAEAAAIVLTSGGNEGRTINLVGPELHTGTSTAEIWGNVLGRRITYAGDDLDAWEKQSLAFLPAFMVFDFRLMYAFFQEHGLKATAQDVERQTALLGHPPRRFEDFAAETARAWSV